MIPIAKPFLDEQEAEAVRRVILSGWITQGPEVAAFEREFAESVGASYACAVSNCTTALHLALMAAGVGPGDEVITVSHSYIATANSIRYCGAIPVFVDIAPGSYNIDPEAIPKVVGPRTRAILCVHQIGMPCDLERIVQIARQFSLPLIEDAACAIGSEVLMGGRWEAIGRPHGDAACFSFHPRKILSTGDGGMITTRHKEWDARFRLLRQHSMSVADTVRHGSKTVISEEYPEIGYNYRMTDVQAAIGREQLRRLPGFVRRRRELASRYQELLGDYPGLRLPVEPTYCRSNWQSYAVGLPDDVNQRSVMQNLLDKDIATRRGIMCAHREPAYQTEPWRSVGPLPLSEAAQDHSILLPLYDQLQPDEQEFVARALRAALTEVKDPREAVKVMIRPLETA
jgi:dTDP-4-amino-4,6-dideoxygalactose transaminase